MGTDHPDIASTHYNIGTITPSKTFIISIITGIILQNQGKIDEALENYQKSLRIRKILYGEEHLDIATSLNNIGNIIILLLSP